MDRDGRPGWLPSLGYAFLTFNCGMAIYRSWDEDDPSAVALVVVAYVSLLLLFRYLQLLEVERRRREREQRLKRGVWGLSTLLTLMFSYKVAAIVPVWAQLLVWAMGTFTVLVGFYAFFSHADAPRRRRRRSADRTLLQTTRPATGTFTVLLSMLEPSA